MMTQKGKYESKGVVRQSITTFICDQHKNISMKWSPFGGLVNGSEVGSSTRHENC